MSITGIGASTFFGRAQATTQSAGQGRAAAAAADGDHDGSSGTTSAAVSRPGRFLSQLQSVAQTDPAQAKQMLIALASKFRAQASQSGGADSSKAQLADLLQKAADSGDYSGLSKSLGQRTSSAGTWGAAAYGQAMAVTRASM